MSTRFFSKKVILSTTQARYLLNSWVTCESPFISNTRPMAWVSLLIICSTSRKSTLLCTTLWLEMAIFTVPFQCIDIESKQHSSKSRICEFPSTEKIWHLRRAYFVCVCLFVSSSVWSVRLSRLDLSAGLTVCLLACNSICVSVFPSVWAVYL